MTVCIAVLFQWNYADNNSPVDLGRSALVVSDRMITAGDVQYEPQQFKVAEFGENVLALVAGDFSIHSEAMKNTQLQLRGDRQPEPERVALIYGQAIQAIKRRQAETLYLSPLNLNTESFLSQQKEMSDGLTNALLERMQSYQGEFVEAIVVGMYQYPVGKRLAHLYVVDTTGGVSCHNDVGFAAIGIGAPHAKSRLMQVGYTNGWTFAPALTMAFAAKKAAEVAPGVGKATDTHMVLRNKILPLWPAVDTELHRLHGELSRDAAQLLANSVELLQRFITGPDKVAEDEGQKGNPWRARAN